MKKKKKKNETIRRETPNLQKKKKKKIVHEIREPTDTGAKGGLRAVPVLFLAPTWRRKKIPNLKKEK